MTHPLFAHITTLSPAERRERREDFAWPWESIPPRKPRDKRYAPPRPALDDSERRALGILDEDE